ncbi:MAG: ATP-dependent Clp protease proteolytic subunit [Dehalococcoidia bacterium]
MKLRVSNTSKEGARLLAFKIVNVSKDEAEIDIWDTIGDPWDGTTAKDFVAELRDIDAAHITLNINSPGGFVDDALAMYNALLAHPADITAKITVAASAASFVAMAAGERLIAKNGKVMIHDAQAGIGVFAMLNAAGVDDLVEQLSQVRSLLDEESENIASIYAERAGGDATTWRTAMQANGEHGTTYRGQAAVDAGLAHGLIGGDSKNAAPEGFRVAAKASEEPVDDLSALLMNIPPLAEHAGYKPPVPNLAGLLEKNPLTVGGK